MIAGVCPAYLPNIQFMSWIIMQKKVAFVTHNTYQKQTFRNRTEIYGANGKLKLSIPIVHKKDKSHQIDKEVKIHYGNGWQKDHWKSLEASYRSSPFFEFYEDDFHPFYHQKFDKLMQFNLALIEKILSLIEADIQILNDEKEVEEFSNLIIAKNQSEQKTPSYRQVFESKHGFIHNLSILDLLFNLGPQSLDYLIEFNQ
ncbi:MAG: WbqC family protein [Flavobacteriaceae bacterium]|jgi:hypothetical protein